MYAILNLRKFGCLIGTKINIVERKQLIGALIVGKKVYCIMCEKNVIIEDELDPDTQQYQALCPKMHGAVFFAKAKDEQLSLVQQLTRISLTGVQIPSRPQGDHMSNSYVESWIKQLEERGVNITICQKCGKSIPDQHDEKNFRDYAGLLYGQGEHNPKDKEGFYHPECWYSLYPNQKYL